MTDLAFSAAQEEQREALRALLAAAGVTPGPEPDGRAAVSALHERLAAEGWLTRETLLDLCILFEELGRAATPGPFLTQLESRLLLLQLGQWEAMAKLVQPPARLSLACTGPWSAPGPASAALVCRRTGDGARLDGTQLFVPFADSATRLLVVAPLDDQQELALLSVDPDLPEVERTPLDGLDAEPLFEVRFHAAAIESAACLSWDAGGALEEALSRAAILACAELAGAAAAALEQAVRHARTREQFGRPIGSFQAVAHHCANMALDVDAARLAVWEAASRCDAGAPTAPHASRAKVVCSEAARRVTTTAHQVLGGVGYLAETGLHLFTRRVKALESRLGSPDFHRERLADALDL